MANCVDCRIKLKGHGKPIRCRSCASKKRMRDGLIDRLRTPEALAKRSATMKKTCSDIEYRKQMSINRRIDWSDGKFDDTFDDAHCKAISVGKLKYFVEHPEVREQMSLNAQEAWARGDFDHVDWEEVSRKIWSKEETREKFSESMKKAWARGAFDGVEHGGCNNPSNLELAVLQALIDLGVEAVGQYRPNGCRFIYDIYLPEHQTLVEVDGEFWHYSEWAAEKGVPEHDAEKDEWALDNGFNIARLPENVLDAAGIVVALQEQLLPELSGQDCGGA